jgi:hypothetical protein
MANNSGFASPKIRISCSWRVPLKTRWLPSLIYVENPSVQNSSDGRRKRCQEVEFNPTEVQQLLLKPPETSLAERSGANDVSRFLLP